MNISYIDPLSGAWRRMKKALFRPFDITKWFMIGFTAFLAGLTDYKGGNSFNSSHRWKESYSGWNDILNFPYTAWDWLNSHPLWFSLIIFGLFFLIALFIVLTWLSSRGKFMFLSNVINDKAEVSKPWTENRAEGNSLFIWRIVFGFIFFILFILLLFFSFILITKIFSGYYSVPAKFLVIVAMVLQFVILIIIAGYISLFLNDFVVPIMFKYHISTNRAWLRFLPLLSKNIGTFIVYGLFLFVLMIAVAICIVIFGLMTCCVGFLLLIIPYIGSILLLPISYTYRAYSVNFLEQFGPEYQLFPPTEDITSENV